MPNIDELWNKYVKKTTIEGFRVEEMTKDRFTQAIAEVISLPVEAGVSKPLIISEDDAEYVIEFIKDEYLNWANENIPECDMEGAKEIEEIVIKIIIDKAC